MQNGFELDEYIHDSNGIAIQVFEIMGTSLLSNWKKFMMVELCSWGIFFSFFFQINFFFLFLFIFFMHSEPWLYMPEAKDDASVLFLYPDHNIDESDLNLKNMHHWSVCKLQRF